MGLAIPVMHYVGMAAVTFTPAPLPKSQLTHAIQISELGVGGIGIATVVILGIVFLLALLDRRFSLQALELELSNQRYRLMAEMNSAQERARAAGKPEARARASSPGQYEPRDPHPLERHHRHDGLGSRDGTDARTKGLP